MTTPHLSLTDIERLGDNEAPDDAGAWAHVSACATCANGVLSIVQMKRAIAALPRRVAPPRAARPRRFAVSWAVAAALAAIALLSIPAVQRVRSRDAARELVDLHSTIIASAQPVDVVSTDRHTVKPWFEGRVPFAVNVPELAATPFRVAGGRAVFWRGKPGAYLLVTKGQHRLSVFIFERDEVPQIAALPQMTVESWTSAGLAYVAVGDIPLAEMQQLRRAFGG
jgi:anti-sigma factor RsiW